MRVRGAGRGWTARNEQKNCFKRKKMCRETAASDFTLPRCAPSRSGPSSPPPLSSSSASPSCPASRHPVSARRSARASRSADGEGNTPVVPVGNFSVLSLTHRNPSTAIHSPPRLSLSLSSAGSLNTASRLQTTPSSTTTAPHVSLTRIISRNKSALVM